MHCTLHSAFTLACSGRVRECLPLRRIRSDTHRILTCGEHTKITLANHFAMNKLGHLIIIRGSDDGALLDKITSIVELSLFS